VCSTPFYYDWYARLDSNQRLSAPEADALSPELRAHLTKNADFGIWKCEKFSLFVGFSQDQKNQRDLLFFAERRSPFSMASLASPTTYREPATQTASSDAAVSTACRNASAT
jgi:hypothetical protein